MTSKLQRKIRAVSETAACAAVEGALDAILFVRNEKKNKEVSLSKGSMCCVFFVGDAWMRMRIRDVQTMPGLEGRGGGGGGGRERGDGERGSLLGIFFFAFFFRFD